MLSKSLVARIEDLGLSVAIEAIVWEVERAERKHPVWPTDVIHMAAIVGEESGELTQAALQHVYEGRSIHQVTMEACETAATAIRLIKNLSANIQAEP
jgi:hypothetical protein